VKENQNSLAALSGSLNQIRNLQPEEQATIDNALYAVALYQQRFAAAVSYLSQPGEGQRDRIQSVLRNYETNLNNVVEQNSRKSRARLVDELRSQVDSFDTQIMSTLQATDPKMKQVAGDLDSSSHEVFMLTSSLEAGNWQRVQDDHKRAQKLLHRAEWVLSIVSALTILLSVWVSVILPRQVVKPLLMLKEAVDHAISGNYQVEFELKGKGEVVELAKSVRTLIAHFTATRQPV
jgi:nitrogen fixation/metabolism regulation signal transduction histidine kinase